MTAQRPQTLNSVYSFRHSISLFSSVEGIFSHDSGDGTRTLQELVKVLQPLKLALYREIDMHRITLVGEGSSYRVFRCNHLNRQLVAAKIMKLPTELSAMEKENFRRRVFCLIKDVEVMQFSPLANHENVLGLLGYGWNLSEDSSLPFLVTEYAEQGTLRDFLREKQTSVVSRLKLCGNIASGLHAMHSCGVSHGDLKLENVLIFQELDQMGSVAEHYSAKLSDFGHACVIYPGQVSGSAKQYMGTIGYIPPEIYQVESTESNFQKYDIWALGLAVWQTLAGGSRYTEDRRVKTLLRQETSRVSGINKGESKEDDTARQSASRPGFEFSLISEHLCQLAVDCAEAELRRKVSHMSQALVKRVFLMSLQRDPTKRCGDVSKLPFTYSKYSTTRLSDPGPPAPYQDFLFVEAAGAQTKWSFEVFTPQELRVSKLPHTTKAQMVADAKSAVIITSDVGESKASSALYVGLAYAVGFGVERNMEECLSWVSRSATQGSSAASLFLEVLYNPISRQDTILGAFRNSVEGVANSSVRGTCRFDHQNSEALDLSSFLTADECNPLHYLSLFEGFTDPGGLLRSNGLDILKRKDKQSVTMGSQSHPESDERSVLQGEDLELHEDSLERSLGEIVRHLGPNFIHKATTKTHYLYAHFPMTLSGTPLSFAISLNCGEAIRALACEVQDASTAFSELRTAISCHHSQAFSLLWSDFLKRETHREFFDLLIFSRKGSQLIAALAHRSSLERTMLHGLHCSSAQTSIIIAVLGSLSELVTEKYNEDENTRRTAFVEMAGEGLEQILQFGDLDIAIEVGQTILSRFITTSSDELHGQGVLKSALDMACSGCFDLDRSKQFLDFARNCRKNLNPDFQALRAMIEHNSVALFQRCVEDRTDVSGCDEDGQNLLHCMILTGFYTLVPVSYVIFYGTDPNHPDGNGQTPLHLAAKVGSPLLVKELLSKCAKSSAVDNDGTSVLLHAIDSRNLSVVEMILEALEANLEGSQVVSLFGQAPKLRDHLSSSSAEKCLNKFGTVDHDNTGDGMTAILLAARNHDTKIVGTLLRHGARLDAKDSNDNTALHYAIHGSENDINDVISCCHILLAANSELPRNKEGDTPLHLAAQRYTADSLSKLLNSFVRQHRCDIDIQNARGETILHQAARQVSVNSVRTILKHGASVNRTDAQGRTAMHHFVQAAYGVSGPSDARDHKLKLMLKILLDAGGDPLIRDNSPNSDGYTAMDYAAINGYAALFFQLLPTARQNSQNPRASEQLLSSAWSFSVAGEQWRLLKQLLAHDSEFDPDLSLLMWPTGAHLLKYAVAVYDRELLERFSSTSSETPDRPSRRANRELLEEDPDSRDEDAAQLRLTYWEGLPSVLRANYGDWSSDQIRFWEDYVKSHGLHRGGDPLNEIFDFLATLDQPTLVAYFGDTDRERFPVNENAFRWEDCVNYLTTPSHAISVLHGDYDKDWMNAKAHQLPDDEREEAKNPGRQTVSGRDDEEYPFLSSSSSSSSERDTAIS